MKVVVGIDVGAYKHAAAVCRAGEREADKKVLRYEATRRGFRDLDLWLERQGEVDRGGGGVERALLVAAGQPPPPAGRAGGRGEPSGGEVLRQEPAAALQVGPRRRAHTGGDGYARPTSGPRAFGGSRGPRGGALLYAVGP